VEGAAVAILNPVGRCIAPRGGALMPRRFSPLAAARSIDSIADVVKALSPTGRACNLKRKETGFWASPKAEGSRQFRSYVNNLSMNSSIFKRTARDVSRDKPNLPLFQVS
jgi:hypothetical protein